MEDNVVDIHGKKYKTVAGRVQEAHQDLTELTITTEVLYQEPVVIKATVKTKKGIFTGISAANPAKSIEKQSPYEVAETSAIGRALGFAGYGIVEGIATADEIVKANQGTASTPVDTKTEGFVEASDKQYNYIIKLDPNWEQTILSKTEASALIESLQKRP